MSSDRPIPAGDGDLGRGKAQQNWSGLGTVPATRGGPRPAAFGVALHRLGQCGRGRSQQLHRVARAALFHQKSPLEIPNRVPAARIIGQRLDRFERGLIVTGSH